MSDVDGSATFEESRCDDRPGWSRLVDPQAPDIWREDQMMLTTVPTRRLDSLLDQYAYGRTVDFLKIDVEGQEAAVVASNDWNRLRPRILVIEALAPGY